jgi:hypothetical protein
VKLSTSLSTPQIHVVRDKLMKRFNQMNHYTLELLLSLAHDPSSQIKRG